jgi:hypothetical protein
MHRQSLEAPLAGRNEYSMMRRTYCELGDLAAQAVGILSYTMLVFQNRGVNLTNKPNLQIWIAQVTKVSAISTDIYSLASPEASGCNIYPAAT